MMYRSSKKLFLLMFLGLLTSFSLFADEKTMWQDFGSILNQGVVEYQYESKNGRFYHSAFDYNKLKKDSSLQGLMNKQLYRLKKATPPQDRDSKLTFWINAYNFFTLVDVQAALPVKSMKKIGWDNKHHDVGGEKYSLNQIEHKILRPLKEPLIHFAINCASIGCPALSKTPYYTVDLSKQLEEATVNALRNPIHIVQSGDILHSTKLFKWFKEDFEIAPYSSVKGFIDALGPDFVKKTDKYKAKISYNWDLNSPENMETFLKRYFQEHQSLDIRSD